ncbi:hypothetical protein LCGC14_2026470, partial [marine sediment metagenome]
QVTMWYDFDFVDLYENGLGDVEFTNMRTGKQIDKNYSFVYWGEKERDVRGTDCSGKSINGTTICESVITGKETYSTWLPYNSKDIPLGNIRIGLMTDVKLRDHVDGVWTIGGKKVTKHAIWTANLNVDIVEYWNFEEGSGTNVEGSLGNYNLTSNSSVWLTGKVGSFGMNFSSITGDFAETTGNVTEIDGTNYTVNGWIKINDEKDQAVVWKIGKNINTIDGTAHLLYNSLNGISTDKWIINVPNTEFVIGSTTNADVGNYVMMTVKYNINTNNLSLYKNGTLDGSVITTRDYVVGKFHLAFGLSPGQPAKGRFVADEIGLWNRILSDAEITQLFNGGTGLTFTDVFSLDIILLEPSNNTIFTTKTNFFVGNVSDPSLLGIQNVSLILDGVINQTNSSGVEGNYNFSLTAPEGNHNWTIEAFDNIDNLHNASNGTLLFLIDLTKPLLNLTDPSGTIGINNGTETIVWTVTDENLDTCSFDYNFTNTSVSCTLNTTTFALTPQRNLTFYANDTAGNLVANLTTWNYLSTENFQTFNSSTFETATETFVINITTNGTAPLNANLVYDGVPRSATIINTAGDDFNISRTITVPLVPSNKSFNFNFTIGGVSINSLSNNQTVDQTNFTICSVAPQNITYINISFKNETTSQEDITAIIDSTFIYSLGTISEVNKTLIFSNVTENLNYSFCLTPGDRNLNIELDMTFSNSESQQRSFSLDTILSSTIL